MLQNRSSVMMSPTYSLPWRPASSSSPGGGSSNSNSGGNGDDSAFHDSDPDYANSSASAHNEAGGGGAGNEYYASPANCLMPNKDSPDYEEVSNNPCSPRKGCLVYNLASEGIFARREEALEELDGGDPITREKIMQSLVYCIHKSDGCRWSGQLSKLKAHLNVCQKDAISCLNQCGAKIARLMMEDHMLTTCQKRLVQCHYCKRDFTGAVIDDHQSSCGFEPVDCENKCGQRIQRNRLKAHQVNTCSKRLVTCAYCTGAFTAETLQPHHRRCRLFPVPCPNRCSAEYAGVPREDMERHLAEDCCANSGVANDEECAITCSFKEAGCTFEANSRQTLEQHVQESTKAHLELMCGVARRQRRRITELSAQLERAATSYSGVLTWKIRDVSAKLAEARTSEGLELVSMPFFTSPSGYRLQASLFLNGNGAGEASHMSVYIKILPGEFDSILKWPFRHTVSFSLLDQSEDRHKACNVVESFLPDPAWPNFQRPSKRPDQLGFGFPKFVSHQMLLGSAGKYVKDDCMFIKIRVDPARNVAV